MYVYIYIYIKHSCLHRWATREAGGAGKCQVTPAAQYEYIYIYIYNRERDIDR